jgi:hypothetical protein
MSSLQKTWPQASFVGAFVASSSSQQVGQWSPSTDVVFSSGFKAARYGFLVGKSKISVLGRVEGKICVYNIVNVKTMAA